MNAAVSTDPAAAPDRRVADDTADVLYEVAEGVATITLNRPAKRNAFTYEMLAAWGRYLGEARADPMVRVIVVTGADGAFCAGADFTLLGARTSPLEQKRLIEENLWSIPRQLENIDKPVIAAMNGVATGVGLDLALMCDLRVAARSARLGETYVKVGVVPGGGGCWLLPRLIGLPRALELLLTGELVDAERAERLGMVNHVYDDAVFRTSAAEFASRLAAGPPLATEIIKRATYQSLEMPLRSSLELLSGHVAMYKTTDDSAETLSAFQEHRPPRFEGR